MELPGHAAQLDHLVATFDSPRSLRAANAEQKLFLLSLGEARSLRPTGRSTGRRGRPSPWDSGDSTWDQRLWDMLWDVSFSLFGAENPCGESVFLFKLAPPCQLMFSRAPL